MLSFLYANYITLINCNKISMFLLFILSNQSHDLQIKIDVFDCLQLLLFFPHPTTMTLSGMWVTLRLALWHSTLSCYSDHWRVSWSQLPSDPIQLLTCRGTEGSGEVGDLVGAAGSWLQPSSALAPYWGVNQQIKVLSSLPPSPSLCLSNRSK